MQRPLLTAKWPINTTKEFLHVDVVMSGLKHGVLLLVAIVRYVVSFGPAGETFSFHVPKTQRSEQIATSREITLGMFGR